MSENIIDSQQTVKAFQLCVRWYAKFYRRLIVLIKMFKNLNSLLLLKPTEGSE